MDFLISFPGGSLDAGAAPAVVAVGHVEAPLDEVPPGALVEDVDPLEAPPREGVDLLLALEPVADVLVVGGGGHADAAVKPFFDIFFQIYICDFVLFFVLA